jgi:hypothetical protein
MRQLNLFSGVAVLAASLLAMLVFSAPAAAQGLEPEEGVFAGFQPPEPYKLVLRGGCLVMKGIGSAN